ncbi:MAG: hypothetical protein IJW21_01755 [Clostridia bacterium]|nr:hypothetical protein [Clostridia bacterium]
MKRKSFAGIFFGVLIIALGIILGGNAVEIWDIDLLFPGWWTLFIIIPALYWMFTSGPDAGNIICLIVGVVLLLDNTETFGKYVSWKLIFPAAIVAVGVGIVVSTLKRSQKNAGTSSESVKFGEQKISFAGEVFAGGKFSCSFGTLTLDLTGAVIRQEKPFRVSCSFGEVKLVLPENVSLNAQTEASFGKVNVLYPQNESGVPLDLCVDCSFGEVTVK